MATSTENVERIDLKSKRLNSFMVNNSSFQTFLQELQIQKADQKYSVYYL